MQNINTYSGDKFNFIDVLPFYVYEAIPTITKVSRLGEALNLISSVNKEDTLDYLNLSKFIKSKLGLYSRPYITYEKFPLSVLNKLNEKNVSVNSSSITKQVNAFSSVETESIVDNYVFNRDSFVVPKTKVFQDYMLKTGITGLSDFFGGYFLTLGDTRGIGDNNTISKVLEELVRHGNGCDSDRLNSIYNSLLPKDNNLKMIKDCYDIKFVRYNVNIDSFEGPADSNSILGCYIIIKEGFGSYLRDDSDTTSGKIILKDIYKQAIDNFTKDNVFNSIFFYSYLRYNNIVSNYGL